MPVIHNASAVAFTTKIRAGVPLWEAERQETGKPTPTRRTDPGAEPVDVGPAGSEPCGHLDLNCLCGREYRKFFDARWRKFRLAALAAARNVCQHCRKPHRLLNVAHLSHDPADRSSLAVLCPSCHAKHDTPQRVAMSRRTRAHSAGQKWLSEKSELAPLPMRTWPLRLRQMSLF